MQRTPAFSTALPTGQRPRNKCSNFNTKIPHLPTSSPLYKTIPPKTSYTFRRRIITTATGKSCNLARCCEYSNYSSTALPTPPRQSQWYSPPRCSGPRSVSYMKAWHTLALSVCVRAWLPDIGGLAYLKTSSLTARSAGDALCAKHPTMAPRRSRYNATRPPLYHGSGFT